MWGIIATWRMAVEGISKASQVLAEGGDAGDAIEIAVREVEDFPYYKSVGYGGLPNEEMEVELDAAFRYWCGSGNQRLCKSSKYCKTIIKRKSEQFVSW